MKLVVCIKNIGSTLQQGDLIAWFSDGVYEGHEVGLYNYLKNGKGSKNNYLSKTPFLVVDLPLVSYEDIQPIIEEMVYLDPTKTQIDDIALYAETKDDYTSSRKWKLTADNLDQETLNSFFSSNDTSPIKAKWGEVMSGRIRKDTINAYLEGTLPTTVIADILVAR